MGISEGHPFAHQIVRRVRGVGKAVHGTVRHPFPPKAHGAQHAGKQGQTVLGRLHGVKGHLLIFLHIFIICKRKPLHGGQQGQQRPIHPTGLPPNQFRYVRILFLRHNAAAGRIGIVDFHELILVGIPDNDLLTEAAHMHHDHGQCGKKFDEIIPVRHGIHAVQSRSLKAQQSRREASVQGIGGARQSPRSQRAVIHSVMDVLQPLPVPFEHLKIGPVVMGQGGGLRLLQMGEPGHICLHIGFHGVQNHRHQFLEQTVRGHHLRPGVQPHVQSHLIVAAAAGMQLLARFSHPLDQISLHKTMDVLIFFINESA